MIPSAALLFPLSQLLPILSINGQSVLLQFTVTLSGVFLLFGRNVCGHRLPCYSPLYSDTHLRSDDHYAEQLWEFRAFKEHFILVDVPIDVTLLTNCALPTSFALLFSTNLDELCVKM